MATIIDKLDKLSKQIVTLDRKLLALDSHISESLKLKNETDFIKVIIIFIY